jgi:hypothetical protein
VAKAKMQNICSCIFFFFCTGFRPIKDEQLIRLMREDMHTGQTLFFLGIELGIPRVRPWKELLATGAQATWFAYYNLSIIRKFTIIVF